jgi:hypothetical protein
MTLKFDVKNGSKIMLKLGVINLLNYSVNGSGK